MKTNIHRYEWCTWNILDNQDGINTILDITLFDSIKKLDWRVQNILNMYLCANCCNVLMYKRELINGRL